MFHLPHGEMGITLQDIEVMLGVPVDGLPMTGSVKQDWLGFCRDLLGHRPLDPILHPHKKQVYPCWGKDKSQLAKATV